jgi:hypothetical protein
MIATHPYWQGLMHAKAGHGNSVALAWAVALVFAGLAVLTLGVTGQFLPHDEHFLGMTARDLCARHGCRIVHFMIHDRIAFGGAAAAVGLLYGWLAASPVRKGETWAWWALLLSGVIGFSSFLAYLGYGYLDTWHGLVALGLLPCFMLGLVQSSRTLESPEGIRCLLRPSVRWPWTSAAGLGRACLLATAAGMTLGGFTILMIGITCVFVPQDLAYMGVRVEELHALNSRLVPLIAHDRAGFGGAVCCCGVAFFFCVWCGEPSPSLWYALGLVGVVGFGAAIGAHPAVGYNDAVHLAPAACGALLWLAGMVLSYRRISRGVPAAGSSKGSK